jgi:hypothetical protein
MDKLSLMQFKETFELYRGRLRGSPRLINQLHLSILANFSAIEVDETNITFIKYILKDLKAFYRTGEGYKRRLDDFLIRKKSDIEIHETVTRIGLFITKQHDLCGLFLDCQFYNDILEILILIGSEEDSNETQKHDFIQRIVNKKGMKVEKAKRFVQGIIENSLKILINLLKSGSEVSDNLTKKVKYK